MVKMHRDQVRPGGGSSPDGRCIWHRLNALCQTHTSAGPATRAAVHLAGALPKPGRTVRPSVLSRATGRSGGRRREVLPVGGGG